MGKDLLLLTLISLPLIGAAINGLLGTFFLLELEILALPGLQMFGLHIFGQYRWVSVDRRYSPDAMRSCKMNLQPI